MLRDFILRHVDSKIALELRVIQKVAFDRLAAITEGNDEIAESASRVNLHDVPDHGAVSDLYHRLGL